MPKTDAEGLELVWKYYKYHQTTIAKVIGKSEAAVSKAKKSQQIPDTWIGAIFTDSDEKITPRMMRPEKYK